MYILQHLHFVKTFDYCFLFLNPIRLFDVQLISPNIHCVTLSLSSPVLSQEKDKSGSLERFKENIIPERGNIPCYIYTVDRKAHFYTQG